MMSAAKQDPPSHSLGRSENSDLLSKRMFAQQRCATGTAQTIAAIAEPAVERTTSDSSVFADLADLASYDNSSSDPDLDDSPAKSANLR